MSIFGVFGRFLEEIMRVVIYCGDEVNKVFDRRKPRRVAGLRLSSCRIRWRLWRYGGGCG